LHLLSCWFAEERRGAEQSRAGEEEETSSVLAGIAFVAKSIGVPYSRDEWERAMWSHVRGHVIVEMRS
jgi:hypothetical protein